MWKSEHELVILHFYIDVSVDSLKMSKKIFPVFVCSQPIIMLVGDLQNRLHSLAFFINQHN